MPNKLSDIGNMSSETTHVDDGIDSIVILCYLLLIPLLVIFFDPMLSLKVIDGKIDILIDFLLVSVWGTCLYISSCIISGFFYPYNFFDGEKKGWLRVLTSLFVFFFILGVYICVATLALFYTALNMFMK
jgi:hypothetical protein